MESSPNNWAFVDAGIHVFEPMPMLNYCIHEGNPPKVEEVKYVRYYTRFGCVYNGPEFLAPDIAKFLPAGMDIRIEVEMAGGVQTHSYTSKDGYLLLEIVK